jgi:hypothetical protein
MENSKKISRNIPNEIKRKVLIESGYKCAIHTCNNNNDLDIHHIIPFEKCNKHEYENLIALCPNCHRKADKGQIDRKALFFYKARLQKILLNESNISEEASYLWRTIKIEEEIDGNPYYSYQIEYPKFNSQVNKSMQEINKAIEGYILDHIHKLRNILFEVPDQESISGTTIAIAFEVISHTSNYCSIRFSIYQYNSGAAHPNQYSESLNFSFNPISQLTLGNLFIDEFSAKVEISNYCRHDLALQLGLHKPNRLIVSGTDPKQNSFDVFNFTDDSIYISFDEYRVASYAEGKFVVKVPFRRLKEFLNSRILLKLDMHI